MKLKLEHVAEMSTWDSILCAAQLYPMMLKAYGDPGPEKLEEVMARMQHEGLHWLATTAGYSIAQR